MTQEELEALLAQIAPNGQPVRLEHTQEVVTRKVRRKVPSGSEFRPDTEEDVEVRVPVLTWIDRGTGRKLVVEVGPDGRYTPTFNGIDPKMQGEPAVPPSTTGAAGTSQPPKEKDEGGRRYVWQPNPGGADAGGQWVDVGPAPTKPSEASEASVTQEVKGRPGWRSVTEKTVRDGRTVETTHYLDPDGKRHETLPEAPAVVSNQSDALEGYPGWRVVKRASKDAQGNSVTETVYLDPSGQEHASPPAAASVKPGERKPVEINGKTVWTATRFNPATNMLETVYEDAEGNRIPDPRAESLPAGAQVFRPDVTKPAYGLIEQREHYESLGLPPDRVRTLLSADREIALTEASRASAERSAAQQDRSNALTQRSQDVSLANSRLQAATSGIATAEGFARGINPYLQPGSDAGARAALGLLLLQGAVAQQWGGFAVQPGGPPPGPTPAAPTAMAPPGPTLGAAPGGPPAPAAPTTLPDPIFRPQPPVTLPPAPLPNGVSDTTDAGGVPRAYTPAMGTNDPRAIVPPQPAPAVPGQADDLDEREAWLSRFIEPEFLRQARMLPR